MKQKDNKRLFRLAVTPLLPLALLGCSDEMHLLRPDDGADTLRLELRATIDQTTDTRADESGFATGDRFGLFVANYSDGAPAALTLGGNQVNNVAMTYNADADTWQPATDIYWRDPVTSADVYGYYPFNNGISSVDAYSFEVNADQSVAGADGEMGSYEASDFLWAKTPKATPGKKVELTFSHAMAGVKVILQKGDGFDGDSWADLHKIVTVDNTVRTSEIDLSTGTVTPVGSPDRHVVMNPEGDAWRAVVVPQTVADGKTVIGLTIDGRPYAYTRSDAMKYTAGKLHTFTIRIDSKGDSGDYSLTLVNEEITPWEADKSSHDFESNSYLVVHVAEAGTLRESLEAMHVDAASVRNLKVTGEMTEEDFRFLRESMTLLQSINIKEISIVGLWYQQEDQIYEKDVLPYLAFAELRYLRRVVLPDNLIGIGGVSFSGCHSLASTVKIPEKVRFIGTGAFFDLQGDYSIELPPYLERIENEAFAWTSAKIECNFANTIKYIGYRAFAGVSHLYGLFALPPNLEYLGDEAFMYSGYTGYDGNSLTGSIDIPVGIKVIPKRAFENMGFNNGTTLTFHDGVTQIDNQAFANLKFNAPVVFPKDLSSIGSNAFIGCYFTGSVAFPEKLSDIGIAAFRDSNLSGTLELPESVEAIKGGTSGAWEADGGTFSYTQIDKLILSKNVSFIAPLAFEGCNQIGTIVCMANEPPHMDTSSFPDIDFNHCVVEVPESSVELYRRTSGWNMFKSITAHHELNLSVSEFSCLNKGISRSLIVRAEGPWEIVEKPEWIHLDSEYGDYKAEINVKVGEMARGNSQREGRVVFRLKDSGYTNYLTVRQYDYEKDEDKEIVLQQATSKGEPVNIFIVGEGYGAESIIDGTYIERAKQCMEDFFSIEPYKTYREMFTVSTAVAMSPDNGAQDVLTSKETKFSMFFPEIDCLMVSDITTDLQNYVKNVASGINDNNIGKSLIIVLANYEAATGSAYQCNDDCCIAFIGNSREAEPYDNRTLVLKIAGGYAFGGLANESVNHYDAIKTCSCPGCAAWANYYSMKERGHYENITVSNKSEDSPWSEFVFHPKYSALVDMYEGGFNHLRGVWRSEPQSILSNNIQYFNTISRYAIYKRIMRRAGLTPSLDEFINNDKIEIPN